MCSPANVTTGSLAYLPRVIGDGHAERTILTSDGVRLHVHDYGSAAAADHTVVLLHGLSVSQESWAGQIVELRRRWGSAVRIITYDHRGHGHSSGASIHSYRIDRLAADLADVLTTMRVKGPLTLAGHSMGGMTALAYLGRPATKRPVEPQGLVLIATAAGRLTERGIGRLLATRATEALFEVVNHLPQRATDRAVRGLMRPVRGILNRISSGGDPDPNGMAPVAAAAIRSISLSTAAGFFNSLKRYDQYHTLASIAAKTIVVSGGRDIVTPVVHARDLARAIPGSMHLHRPNAGHMILQDAPQCVSAAINSAMNLLHDSARIADDSPRLAGVS